MGRMKQVNVHEAKTHLSRLLEEVEAGDDVVISRAGRPVARLVRIAPTTRKIGQDAGLVHIAADFDAPLDPDILADFER